MRRIVSGVVGAAKQIDYPAIVSRVTIATSQRLADAYAQLVPK
jgi:hypothetical protein